ncbi:hypothetical protein Tco_1260556, partial [Tanacetum coccineum]
MVKSYYERTQRSRQERPGEVAKNSSGTAGIERPQAFARISVEIKDTLDGTPRKKSMIARDDVNKESNENRNNWKVCFDIKRLRRQETPWIVGDDSARSEPTEVADSNDFKPLLKEKRLKEQTYYEGTQRSRQERPGEVAENSSGTAGIERPQAFARISVEIEDTLDGTPRKKSRIARDDVNKESNENRNNWKVCFGFLVPEAEAIFGHEKRFQSSKVVSYKNFLDVEELKLIQSPPNELKHIELKVIDICGLSVYEAVVDVVLWCCCPRFLKLTAMFQTINAEERQ